MPIIAMILVGSALGIAALVYGVYKLVQARNKANAVLLALNEPPPSKRRRRSVAEERQGAFRAAVKRMRTLRFAAGSKDYLAVVPSSSLARSSAARTSGLARDSTASGRGTPRGSRVSRGRSMKTTDMMALTAASGSATMRRGGRIPAFEEAQLW